MRKKDRKIEEVVGGYSMRTPCFARSRAVSRLTPALKYSFNLFNAKSIC
jgi:hypothetical protein